MHITSVNAEHGIKPECYVLNCVPLVRRCMLRGCGVHPAQRQSSALPHDAALPSIRPGIAWPAQPGRQ